jgi:hypothetical protein
MARWHQGYKILIANLARVFSEGCRRPDWTSWLSKKVEMADPAATLA